MQRAGVVDPLVSGQRALEAGDWLTAREAFTVATARDASTPEAWEGLARSCWWLGDTAASLAARTRAYSTLRHQGRMAEAARLAVILAREHRARSARSPVADGWLARARRTAGLDGGEAAGGWILLAEGEATADTGRAIECLEAAVATAERVGDPDLEVVALARLGLTRVALGRVEQGLADLDEAMAAASAGEGRDPTVLGEACCALLEAASLLADPDHVLRWGATLEAYRRAFSATPLRPPLGDDGRAVLEVFCASCCGGFDLVTGQLDDAEPMLEEALRAFEEQGLEARCVHPAAHLAELRLLQGRPGDAAGLLARYEEHPECARPLAVLDLARNEPDVAAARLRQAIDRLGERLLAAVPLLEVLVDAELARDDLAGAAEAAEQLAWIAALTRSPRHGAVVEFAEARIRAATDPAGAAPALRASSHALADAQAPLEACRARLAYAAALATTEPATAAAEARGALSAFERLGAAADADRAAALLRRLGVRNRTGPRGAGVLSRRETQVLRLIAEGLTNREIAEQLHISAKTAGHHVSRILVKLGVRSRTEAAAWALLHLEAIPR